MIASGILTSPESAISDFRATADVWNKNELKSPRTQKMLISFKRGEVSPAEAHEFGRELCERYCPGHQALVVTHTDSESGIVHNHIDFCATNLETGKEFNTHFSALRLQKLVDDMCREKGLSVINKQDYSFTTTYTHAEKAISVRGDLPWKWQMEKSISAAVEETDNMESFIENLKRRGITATARNRTYEDGTKDLDFTFTDQHGHRCRARKLGDGKSFTRRSISQFFSALRNSPVEFLTSAVDHAKTQKVEKTLKKASSVLENASKYSLSKKVPPLKIQEQIHNLLKLAENGNEEARQILGWAAQKAGKEKEDWLKDWVWMSEMDKHAARNRVGGEDSY